ncbi:MAG: twitching motility protein PilT [Lachnospiraceae bacterium]|jgi:ABC-type cobalamin/Fe3+-siderophores transport system ATPase subunit|nr:twitching motility protein PilT [Lachnospiraceae bacterium]
MIQLITGEKGKGKTKYLLDNVNSIVKTATGNIVYLDKNAKHMYDLNNKIRLIDLSEYDIFDSSEFFGFLIGIISQDHDLESVHLDSFLELAQVQKDDEDDMMHALDRLSKIGEKYDVSFVVSLSKNLAELPEIPNAEVLYSL